jgi:WD40 repeat protein
MSCDERKLNLPITQVVLCVACLVLTGTVPVHSQSMIVPRPYAAAAFSLDGKSGAFSQRNSLKLVDLATWKIMWTAAVQSGSFAAIAFSHDGSQVAAAINDFRNRSPLGQPVDYFVKIQTFDVATGRNEKELVDPKATMIKDLSFTSDGSLSAVVQHGDPEVLLWNVFQNRFTPLSQDKRTFYSTAIFSPSGDVLALAITTSEHLPKFDIRIFETVTGSLKYIIARGTSPTRAIPLTFSQDGINLAFAIEDWDQRSAKPTHIGLFSLNSHKITRTIKTGEIAVDSLVFPEDGRTILGSGSNITRADVRPVDRVDRTCIWDLGTGKLKRLAEKAYNRGERRDPAIKSLCVPGRNMFVFLGAVGNLFFYDSITLRSNGAVPVVYPSDPSTLTSRTSADLLDKLYSVSVYRILALSLGPNGRIFAGSSDGNLYSWDIPPGKRLDGPKLGNDPEVMAISLDGLIAISRNSEPDISVVNAISGKAVQFLHGLSNSIRALAFSPDGEWLAGADDTGTIQVWNAKDWQAQPRLTEHREAVSTLAFSRDSSLLASGGDDGIIRIRELTSGTLICTLTANKQKVSVIAFGATNELLASASLTDSSVLLWQLANNREPKKLHGHVGPIRGLVFSPDGLSLIGVGDASICLWSSPSGDMIRILAERAAGPQRSNAARYSDTMTVVTFSPDGKVMVCGGSNNTLLLWDVATWRSRTLR